MKHREQFDVMALRRRIMGIVAEGGLDVEVEPKSLPRSLDCIRQMLEDYARAGKAYVDNQGGRATMVVRLRDDVTGKVIDAFVATFVSRFKTDFSKDTGSPTDAGILMSQATLVKVCNRDPHASHDVVTGDPAHHETGTWGDMNLPLQLTRY